MRHGLVSDSELIQVVFAATSSSTLNSYGYSPHPLSVYTLWIKDIILSHPESTKPFIMSITSSVPSELSSMLDDIQKMRAELGDSTPGKRTRVTVELNSSCPNIRNKPPPSYSMPSLLPLLEVMSNHYRRDPTLTIGLKLPPYVYAQQFTDVVTVLASLTHEGKSPIAFLTCTNTLGSSLLFEDQVVEKASSVTPDSAFALPTPLGGLAGEGLHALALGNVYTFTRLLSNHPDPAIQSVSVIGVGGVTDTKGRQRMLNAGAKVVGCATLLGREGVAGFARM
jgi:dihydroorotate dehydrogenase (fumarate)